MDSCCPTTIDLARLHARQRRVLVIVLAINAATFLVMVAAGLLGRSTSLLSGALDNFGDALTYALSLAVVGASGTAVFETMGAAALVNVAANAFCLWLLTPHRSDDINMASVWECSRNDVAEGAAVLVAAGGVWLFGSGWPDLLIAAALLALFLRSSVRVLGDAWRFRAAGSRA